MTSIIDRISEAEQKAAEIKKEAVLKVKSIVADAELTAKNNVSQASKKAVGIKNGYISEAEHKAASLSEEILSANVVKAEEFCTKSFQNMDSAVDYIIERALAL